MDLEIENIKVGEVTKKGYRPLSMHTSRGTIEGHYYGAENEKTAVIYVGGVGGGFDTPASGLYPRLCRELVEHKIGGLRIKYRNATDLTEAVLDVLAGIAYLESLGVKNIGLVGHSFGGAVVIQAGARSDAVRTVVTLATQSYGAEVAAELEEKSLLLVHGDRDEILPPACSTLIHKIAPGPKKFAIVKGSSHSLKEHADEVYGLVLEWLLKTLAGPDEL